MSICVAALTILFAGCGGGSGYGGGGGGGGSAPAVPAGVTATPGNTQVAVSWNAVSGATSYNIYFSTTPGVTKANGTKFANVISPFTHNSLTNSTAYYYVVTAVNGYGESGDSSEVTATPLITLTLPPTAPAGVTASPGNGLNTIAWSPVALTSSYNIYWSNTTGVTKSNGAKIAGVTSPHTHNGLANGTPYYYVVTAVNPNGESPDSSQVTATPQANMPPSAPTGVTAIPGNKQVIVSWSPVTGATSYNIYWSITPGVTKATGIKIAGVTSPYTQTGLATGTPYYYVVTAVNLNGEGVESLPAFAMPN